MDYLTHESEELVALQENLATVERTLRNMADILPDIGRRERYLTGVETCRLLHISPRTLQSLRDKRMISFTVVGDRTILYPESELHAMLMRNYRQGKNACK